MLNAFSLSLPHFLFLSFLQIYIHPLFPYSFFLPNSVKFSPSFHLIILSLTLVNKSLSLCHFHFVSINYTLNVTFLFSPSLTSLHFPYVPLSILFLSLFHCLPCFIFSFSFSFFLLPTTISANIRDTSPHFLPINRAPKLPSLTTVQIHG